MKIALFCSLFFCSCFCSGQVNDKSSKKTDSIAQKVIHYFALKQPDSVYQLTGKAFREQITAENFTAITTSKIFPLTDFKLVKYISTANGINKYRVEGTPTLQLLVGLDTDDKISTLLVQEFVPD